MGAPGPCYGACSLSRWPVPVTKAMPEEGESKARGSPAPGGESTAVADWLWRGKGRVWRLTGLFWPGVVDAEKRKALISECRCACGGRASEWVDWEGQRLRSQESPNFKKNLLPAICSFKNTVWFHLREVPRVIRFIETESRGWLPGAEARALEQLNSHMQKYLLHTICEN